MPSAVDKAIAAYSEESFQKKLKKADDAIVSRLTDAMESLSNDYGEPRRVIVEHRVKSSASLREKMKRKGYASKGGLDGSASQADIVNWLLCTVPDLIGIRLNCLFIEDEEALLSDLLSLRCESLSFEDDSTKTKTTQHRVCKLNGKYRADDNEYRFEVQVKSYIDNLWGEVDHKRFYKSKGYVLQRPLMEETMRQARNILEATDKQLKAIYHSDVSEDDLLKGLFFEKSKDAVSRACGEHLLGVHYESFYDLLVSSRRDNLYELITNYVREEAHSPEQYQGMAGVDSVIALRNLTARIISERYVGYNLEMLYHIASELFSYSSEREFQLHLAELVIGRYFPDDLILPSDDGEGGSAELDPFDEDSICPEDDADAPTEEAKELREFINRYQNFLDEEDGDLLQKSFYILRAMDDIIPLV